MIKITALNKFYKSKKRKLCHAIKDINLTLPDAGLIFVLGKSGSGKSTLLNLIGGLDNITSGSIEVDGNDLAKFKEKDFCNYRNSHIGFIFQDYHLIDELTVYENIKLSLDLENRNEKHLIGEALARVDLAGYEERYPSELSGGEQQRVAIARAIVKKPRIILADEPTGNLDTNTAKAIVELLKELSKECLILIVSHNVNDANNYADRIIELKKGQIISDKSRNPEFLDEVSLQNGELVYPNGLSLSEKDIDFINNNLNKKFILKTDKFLPTNEPKNEAKKVKILNKHLTLGRELKLSGKFLKNKALAISLSAFMVAVIMVIMALAQTIIAFDGGQIVAEEMNKQNQSSILLNKVVDKESEDLVDGSYHVKVDENDIEAFYDAGYNGKIYPVYSLTVILNNRYNTMGRIHPYFIRPDHIEEGIGTLIVDEEFLIDKYGKIEYLAEVEEWHPSGLIITDYMADSIIEQKAQIETYEDVIGEHFYKNWSISQLYINAVINTGYKERYAEILEILNETPNSITNFENNKLMQEFTNEIYTSLGLAYSLNEDLFKDYEIMNEEGGRAKLWMHKIMINDVFDYRTFEAENQYIHRDPHMSGNEINISYKTYNEMFGTSYTPDNLDTFVPHTIKLTQYMHYDYANQNPLLEEEVLITHLNTRDGTSMYSSIFVSDDLYQKFLDNNFFAYSLYFDGTDGIGAVLDTAETLNFEPQSFAIEGVHSMTKAVDVFIPIFELISIFLYVGVIFILMNFSSKMINDKMHEIGILKALGTKNSTVGVVFGLQVMLIALLTCGLSTLGYLLFIDVANDILIESVRSIAPSWPMPDLQFLTFKPTIALMNCALIFVLAFASLIFPMIKIKAIKPVKIIKAKE